MAGGVGDLVILDRNYIINMKFGLVYYTAKDFDKAEIIKNNGIVINW